MFIENINFNNPLVSIIIPYYNKQNTINRSLECILKQTFKNWEVIIIDDKSDIQLHYQEEWTEYNINIIYNKDNLGAAKTRQIGLNKANGEYVVFLDADDWWSELFLELCVEKLGNNISCAGVYVQSLMIYSKTLKKLRKFSNISFVKIIETLLQYPRPWLTGGIVWRKCMVGSWGHLRTSEDSWFEFKTALFNNILLPIDQPLYFVDRTNQNTLSFNTNKKNAILDQQQLFFMVYEDFWKKLSFFYRIILVNRLIRGQIQIIQNCPELRQSMYYQFRQLNIYFLLIPDNLFILKIIHKALQNTPLKIHFKTTIF